MLQARPAQKQTATTVVSLALVLLLTGCLPLAGDVREQAPRIPATVASITDGDTITVALRSEGRERVRLTGIDTPETKHPSKPVQCFGPEASARTTELALGKPVELELDAQKRDEYGRLLAYVWLPDGRMLNLQLAAEGYALPLTIPPNVAYAEQFAAAAASAREQQTGLWADCGGGEARTDPRRW